MFLNDAVMWGRLKMHKTIVSGCLAAFAALASLSIANSAFASVIEYTSQSAFDAANPTAETYGFNAGGEISFVPDSSTFNGVTFTDEATAADATYSEVPLLALIDSDDNPTYGVDFLSFENQNPNIGGVINPTGTTFFGFDYGSFLDVGGEATLTLNTGDSFTITPSSTESFIGFSSSTPITSITIDYPDGYAFDIASYSTTSAAPEPAAWLMMLIGVGVVGASMRRRAGHDRDEDRFAATVSI